MKKLHDFMSVLVVLAIGFSSCSQDKMTDTSGGGRLAIKVVSDTDVVLPSTKNEFAEQAPDPADFKLDIYQQDELLQSWDRFEEFKQNTIFPSGNYLAKASLGDVNQEGFSKPYFEGKQGFQILTDEETVVNLTCYLANTKASVEYTDAFKKYFAAYSASIHSGSNQPILFSGTETRAAYFKPSDLTVQLQVTNQQGSTSTLKAASIDQTLPKHHYRFKFDVDAGSATLKVTFDTSTAEESIDIDISDEALNAAAPVITTTNYKHNEILDVVEGQSLTVSPLEAFIHAKSGIVSCKLKTESPVLQQLGIPSEMELVKLSKESEALLTNQGITLKGLSNNVDKMAVVDFTQIIPKLYLHFESDTHTFMLEVVDRYNKITQSVLVIRSKDNGFSVQPLTPVALGSATVDFPVNLYGDPSLIQVQMQAFGTWQNLPVEVIQSQESMHTVRATFPKAILSEIPVRIVWKNKILTSQIPVRTPSFEVKALSPGSVFAGYARLHVVGENAFATEYFKTKDIYVECALEGTDNWYKPEQTKTEDEIRIVLPVDASKTNTYKIRSKWIHDENEIPGTDESLITTEPALQLSNAGFEDWSEAMVWKKTSMGGKEIYAFYAAGGWASYNDKTTQPRADYSWYYGAYPGTVPTAKTGFTATNHLNRFDGKAFTIEAHSGTNAMEIATVGWGKNNWGPGGGSTEYKQPGLLYLGTYDRASQEEIHGISFNSRPEAVEFYYKYFSYNNESAKVTVVLEDENHQEVGRGELKIMDDTQVFTKGRVAVTYSQLRKAAFIRVEFLSTDAESPETKGVFGSAGLFSGYGDSRHIGSILTVDDVSLIY